MCIRLLQSVYKALGDLSLKTIDKVNFQIPLLKSYVFGVRLVLLQWSDVRASKNFSPRNSVKKRTLCK